MIIFEAKNLRLLRVALRLAELVEIVYLRGSKLELLVLLIALLGMLYHSFRCVWIAVNLTKHLAKIF